jgi:hypothetical protein
VTTVVLIVLTNIWYFACGVHDRSSALYAGSPGGPPLAPRDADSPSDTGPASESRGGQPAAPTGQRPAPQAHRFRTR